MAENKSTVELKRAICSGCSAPVQQGDLKCEFCGTIFTTAPQPILIQDTAVIDTVAPQKNHLDEIRFLKRYKTLLNIVCAVVYCLIIFSAIAVTYKYDKWQKDNQYKEVQAYLFDGTPHGTITVMNDEPNPYEYAFRTTLIFSIIAIASITVVYKYNKKKANKRIELSKQQSNK